MMEGAEESASTDLEKYLENTEMTFFQQTYWFGSKEIEISKGQLEIDRGQQGIITFDLSVESADVDIHSKFGAVIESASWYLLNAISSMRDDQGRILIDGIYEKIVQPNEREMDLIETYAIENADSLRKIYGLKLPILESDRRAFLKNLLF